VGAQHTILLNGRYDELKPATGDTIVAKTKKTGKVAQPPNNQIDGRQHLGDRNTGTKIDSQASPSTPSIEDFGYLEEAFGLDTWGTASATKFDHKAENEVEGFVDKLEQHDTKLDSPSTGKFEGEFELLNTCDVVKDMKSDKKASRLIPQLIAEAEQIEAEKLHSGTWEQPLDHVIQIQAKLENAAELCDQILMHDKALDLRTKAADSYVKAAIAFVNCHNVKFVLDGFDGSFMECDPLEPKYEAVALFNISEKIYTDLAKKSVGKKKDELLSYAEFAHNASHVAFYTLIRPLFILAMEVCISAMNVCCDNPFKDVSNIFSEKIKAAEKKIEELRLEIELKVRQWVFYRKICDENQ
jgi:hypothetical protein